RRSPPGGVSPACAPTSAAGASTAEAAEAAPKPAAAATGPAAPAAAERADPARPAAPPAAAPPPGGWRTLDEPADDENRDEQYEDCRELNRRAAALRPPLGRRAHAFERHVPRLGKTGDDTRRPGAQTGAVLAAAEFGDDVLAAGFAGEAVRDPFLEPVADLDPDLPLLERDQNQQAVFLLFVADAAAVVLEQLVRVLSDVAVRLDRLTGRDGIAGRGALQARDAGQQRRKRRRRLHDEHGQRVGILARLEIALTQVQQMAARLQLARAPHVGGLDAQSLERVFPGDDNMI